MGHRTILGDYTWVAPGVDIAGDCSVGSCCFLAMGCTLINGITVAKEILVGAGSTVRCDLTVEGKTYIAKTAQLVPTVNSYKSIRGVMHKK